MARALVSALAFAFLVTCAYPAAAQKQGGTLRMYLWDNPPSASIHEEATVSTVMPFMALFNNLVLYDQHKSSQHQDTIQPELATSWAWNDDKTQAHLQAARRREVARRQAVHGQGRGLHARQAAGQGHGHLPQEPAQDLVAQPERGDGQRRPRGDVPPRANRNHRSCRCSPAATSPIYPCHVSAADMRTKPIGTGPFQVRRVQEQRVRQGRAQPRLLEEGASLPRRHRLARHLQPFHPGARLRRRRVRHDLRRSTSPSRS